MRPGEMGLSWGAEGGQRGGSRGCRGAPGRAALRPVPRRRVAVEAGFSRNKPCRRGARCLLGINPVQGGAGGRTEVDVRPLGQALRARLLGRWVLGCPGSCGLGLGGPLQPWLSAACTSCSMLPRGVWGCLFRAPTATARGMCPEIQPGTRTLKRRKTCVDISLDRFLPEPLAGARLPVSAGSEVKGSRQEERTGTWPCSQAHEK